MKRPSIRVPDVVARLARRAAITPDGFPPVLSGFPKGGASGLDFGPGSSSTGSTGSDGSGSGSGNPASSTTSTSGTPSSSTVPPDNNSSSSYTTALATATAPAAASSTRLPPAALGGIAVGSSLSLLVMVVVVWLVVRRRQRWRDSHVQLDDGASDGTSSSRLHVGDSVPFARKTTAADVESSPSLSLWSTGASADVPPVPSPLADNDAPPAYEELTGEGRHTVTIGLQAAPGISPVSDGFRQYGPTLEGDAKGLQ